MTASLDVDAYLERIQWSGDVHPTYDTLRGLLSAHMAAIPFENLDVLLGRGVRIDLGSVQAKLVRAQRGGYCFEHATLFAAVLEQLRFQTIRHAARVVLFAPPTQSPRTHMFLSVRLAEGTFVVDPGFGPFASRHPLPLVDGAAARADQQTHWMARDGRYWVLRTKRGDKIIDGWVSTLEEENLVDFELGNHFTATHSGSPFVNRIMMSAFTRDGRVSVMNRDVTTWHANEPQCAQLADRAALRALMIDHFGFDLPEVERLRVPSIPEWD